MAVGQLSNIASTYDFTLTRNQLIEYAFQTAKVLPEGETLSAEQLDVGISRLNMIVREVDQSGNWVWTVQDATHLSLLSGVAVYDANAGLKQNISELVSVSYRDKNGMDSQPLKILQAESYEEITNKLDTGTPCAVYLTNDIQLSSRRLYVWPSLSSVSTQSKVIGSDTNIYKCVYPHTSSAASYPTSGNNWRMVWELSSGAASSWAASTVYSVAESLRIVYKRPLYDFDTAANTPDFPMQFPRLLMLRLAQDVALRYGIPTDHQEVIAAMIRGSFTDIFASTRPKSTDLYNKAKYF